MRQHPVGPARLILVAAVILSLLWTVSPTSAFNPDTEVTVGSDDAIFSQNKQNEPAIAVDPVNTNVLAAGANDNIDMEACNAGNPTTCPFTDQVGGTGIQFSFDAGTTWMQPTYTGWTARQCLGPAACVPAFGPIGTLPWYFEEGLVSDGDPALAFGPQPGANGSFSWSNGVRLYVANLTSNFSANREDRTFKGFEAIAVSRIDGPASGLTPAIVNDKNSWTRPVIASQRQSSATFADKEQIWVDNASSSPFFGNVYVCFAQFRGSGAAPLVVIRSTDGGDTWEQRQVTAATNVPPMMWGQSGCTIRTDSAGAVFVFYESFQSPFRFLPPRGSHFMVKSFDGGRSWTRPALLFQITDPCYFVDPRTFRCVMDGIAGARNDLAASPNISIANGAPTGANATNLIVDVWADGRDGLNNEQVLLSYSNDGGQTWSPPTPIGLAGHRGYYAAPALSPDGQDLYVVYNAFTTPFRNDTTSSRGLIGVVRHADIATNGAPIAWTTLNMGAVGDPRGSSQNNLAAEFLGDYVYAIATNTYGAAVWNDARNAADCPAIDAWRASLTTASPLPTPAPQVACPTTFGNTDIFGGSYPDPTP